MYEVYTYLGYRLEALPQRNNQFADRRMGEGRMFTEPTLLSQLAQQQLGRPRANQRIVVPRGGSQNGAIPPQDMPPGACSRAIL